MKIAYIYDAVYPWIKGGAEKRVYEIAKRLAKNHEVHWYGVGWWWKENKPRDIVFDGIHLHAVCKPIDLYDNGKRSPKAAIYFALKLLPQLLKENFDIIDCQGTLFFACFTARLHSIIRKSKLVITWHEVWYDYWYEYFGKKGIFGKSVEKMTLRLNSKMIAVSGKTKKDLEKVLKDREISIIPNGIDFNEIQKIKLSKVKSDVIYVGRLIKYKNVDFLIKSIKLLETKNPDINCIIVGDGPEKDDLKKLAEELNIEKKINFIGFLEDYNEVISYMKSSKVFVLPSTREGFGMVVIEANACGLPVVVIDYKMNASMELIKHQVNGFISKLSAENIAYFIGLGIDKGEEMQNECIESAKKYDWDRIVDSLEKLYTKYLHKINFC